MIIQNFWFIVLAFTVIDFVWVRKLSSYDSKWIMFYTLYILLYYWNYGRPDNIEKCFLKNYLEVFFFYPAYIYFGFGFIYKYIKNWRVMVRIKKCLDWFYLELKKLV